ncbi:uncharacterized protein LOC109815203 [Cajanus cajan]|uniref:uncharacterized protein LOC109815203 n=1 Tax=Cajanus cajan TaxID=3821 RepID=UPI0010FB4AE8|nr:uncharacterized protein LOC109815203 [Cajanus cajan]
MASQPSEVCNLLKEGVMHLELEGGNRLLPKFKISSEKYEDLCKPWRKCLIIKLLGKNIGFLTMKDKLRNSWKLEGDFDLIDISNGFFLVNFDVVADREKVMLGGPWMIFDHYLIVRQWDPDFSALEAKVNKTLVWVRFPGLGMVFYNESVLLTIASAIGKPVKVDRNTLNMNRGRFARVCVEIDLDIPVVGKFNLNDHWYKVEYEGLHIICTHCGCYGHYARDCTTKTKDLNEKPEAKEYENIATHKNTSEENDRNKGEGEHMMDDTSTEIPPVEEAHGEWLIVTRKKRIPTFEKDKTFLEKSKKVSQGLKPEKRTPHVASTPRFTFNSTSKATDPKVLEEKEGLRYAKKCSRTEENVPLTSKVIFTKDSIMALRDKAIPKNLEVLSSRDNAKSSLNIVSLGGPRYLLRMDDEEGKTEEFGSPLSSDTISNGSHSEPNMDVSFAQELNSHLEGKDSIQH